MRTTASMHLVVVLLLAAHVCAGCYESPEVCQPDCAGRVCGPDPRCNLSCGTCADGMTCNAAGQCTLAGGDPGPADGGEAPADGDAGYDAGQDAGNDAGADTGSDAGQDAGNDAGVDAGGDPGGPCDQPGLDCRLPDDQTPVSQGPDEDEDGWGVCCDCDDGDPDVHPYLVENTSDGKDNDCNGLVDEPGGLMVRASVLGTTYWIDVYEVGVYDNPDCTGTQYGVEADDYPEGFPPAGTATVTLYACSLPGVIPSGHLSWNRARRACEAQGKKLCSADEWGAGCAGDANYWYPYGPGFSAGVCNDPVAGARAPVPAGSRGVCLSPAGTYDQSGNLAEWVQDWDPDFPDNALTGGGSYARELCAEGADCYQGDPEDPLDLDKFQDSLDCLLSAQRFESFVRSDPRPYLGARCCYKDE